jgi:hypothetical protein
LDTCQCAYRYSCVDTGQVIEPLAYGNSARDSAKFKNKLMGVMVIFNLQKNKQARNTEQSSIAVDYGK